MAQDKKDCHPISLLKQPLQAIFGFSGCRPDSEFGSGAYALSTIHGFLKPIPKIGNNFWIFIFSVLILCIALHPAGAHSASLPLQPAGIVHDNNNDNNTVQSILSQVTLSIISTRSLTAVHHVALSGSQWWSHNDGFKAVQ